MPDWEIKCDKLLVYFIFTYFCGAALLRAGLQQGADGGKQCSLYLSADGRKMEEE